MLPDQHWVHSRVTSHIITIHSSISLVTTGPCNYQQYAETLTFRLSGAVLKSVFSVISDSCCCPQIDGSGVMCAPAGLSPH